MQQYHNCTVGLKICRVLVFSLSSHELNCTFYFLCELIEPCRVYEMSCLEPRRSGEMSQSRVSTRIHELIVASFSSDENTLGV